MSNGGDLGLKEEQTLTGRSAGSCAPIVPFNLQLSTTSSAPVALYSMLFHTRYCYDFLMTALGKGRWYSMISFDGVQSLSVTLFMDKSMN